jgi:uncharacterized membrane protein YjjP (DUF1212 family)
MKTGERSCYVCGENGPKQTSTSPSLRGRWATFVSIAFFASLALTIASLFASDYTPPFIACITASVVLFFLKRASDQFTRVKQ